MEEYKPKSYRGFIIWIVSFVVSYVLLSIKLNRIFESNSDITIKLSFMYVSCFLTLLIYIIYKTENIYWINGTSYEQAKNAMSEQRKKFAYRHLVRFFIATIIYVAYCIVGFVIKTNAIMDIIIFLILIISAALSTIKIQLD